MLLEREVAIDSKEHEAAVSAADKCLADALHHYKHALAGTDGPQLRTVFRVIKIWWHRQSARRPKVWCGVQGAGVVGGYRSRRPLL